MPPGSAKASRRAARFDAVAEDVVLVDHDVAEIDADAEIDAPLGWHARVARGHLALHLDRATNRIDHARELADQTVARHVDNAAAVLLDLGIGNLTTQHLQRGERAFLIRPHQARVARDAGRQDRRQAPLDPFLCHGRRPDEVDKRLRLQRRVQHSFSRTRRSSASDRNATTCAFSCRLAIRPPPLFTEACVPLAQAPGFGKTSQEGSP